MNAQPQTSVVGPDELPVHAELHWASRGALLFDVTQITKRNDLGAQSMAVPPSGATFTQGALQASGGELRVEPKELAAIHSGPIDLGPQAAGTTHSSLGLINVHDTPRFVWIDGAPVAWVAADARIDLSPLPRGRYQIEWRPSSTTPSSPRKRRPSRCSPKPSNPTQVTKARALLCLIADDDASVDVRDVARVEPALRAETAHAHVTAVARDDHLADADVRGDSRENEIAARVGSKREERAADGLDVVFVRRRIRSRARATRSAPVAMSNCSSRKVSPCPGARRSESRARFFRCAEYPV